LVDNPMSCHRVAKWFRDYADDIEAVSIHYVVTAADETPDWNNARATRYMPLVGSSVRMKELRLPLYISDAQGRPSSRYSLHYYFEVCQGGDRQYSPLYSEEVVTKANEDLGAEVERPGNEVVRG